ncbi:MAG: hypothetical protein J6X18_02580, partial [Bacteroidales bacterium]|nr:hypothetical protein [Bacteroidales bacterium]
RLTVKPFNQNQGACTGSGNYALGTTVQITASPKQNHFFKEWDDGDTNSTRDVVINGNRTYVAHFTYKEQVVTSPSVSGGYATGGGTYRSGDVATMQAIAQPGWRFSHWLADGVIYEGEKYSFVVTGDTTIIPVFTPNTYTVYLTPSPMGGGYFTSSNQQPSYEYGDTVTYTAIPVYGYEFVSWDDGVTTPQRTFTITANVRMNAVFATKTASHTVTIVLPDSSYVCPVYYNGQDIGYKQNTTVTATAPEGAILRLDPATPDGQVLVSVTDSDSNVVWSSTSREAIEYTVGDSDEELTLNYQNLEYDLRVTLQPTNQYTLNSGMFNVSIDGNGSYYQPTQQEPMRLYSGLAYGTPIVLTAPLYMGSYIFSHWVTDVGSFGTYTVSFGMVKDIKCIAVYSENAI